METGTFLSILTAIYRICMLQEKTNLLSYFDNLFCKNKSYLFCKNNIRRRAIRSDKVPLAATEAGHTEALPSPLSATNEDEILRLLLPQTQGRFRKLPMVSGLGPIL